MADYISQIKLPDNSTYDLKDSAALPKAGGTMTGTINRYYSNDTTLTPMLALKSTNKTVDLFQIGHSNSASANYSHYYALRYTGQQNAPNNNLKLIYNDGTQDNDVITIKQDGTVEINGTSSNITGTLALANLIGGDENTVLMGQGTISEQNTNFKSPAYVSVSPSISITAGTSSNAPKINLTVLGISGTAQTLTKATTAKYGVTKLSEASNSESLAATAKSVYDLDVKVDGLLAAADAMIFKGIVNTDSDLPVIHEAGNTYRVGTAGEYRGKQCEIGTLIICVTDRTTALGENEDDNDEWTSVETNEDGSVIGPTSVTATNNIALFDGTTGRIIKDSGVTLAQASVASAATISTTGGTTATFWRGDNSWSDTLIGSLYINTSTQASATNALGALIIGTKTSKNVTIDEDRILARNNSIASTLYLNNDGGLVSIGSGGLSTSGKITSTLVGEAAQFGNNSVLSITDNNTESARSVDIQGKLNLHTYENNLFGRISFFKNNYRTWYIYMGNGSTTTDNKYAGTAPTGGQPSILGSVTAWALRSLVTAGSQAGWIWEAAPITEPALNTTTPIARMALSSYTGRLRIAPDASSATCQTGGLIIDSATNASSSAAAIELWRGNNASWQIIANNDNNLCICNNYTTTKQNSYTQTSITVNCNTGNTTFAGNITANSSLQFTNDATITVPPAKSLDITTTTEDLSIGTTTGDLSLSTTTGNISLSSGSTTSIAAATTITFNINNTEKSQFNQNGMFQLNDTGTQSTHKLYVNGDSAFNGKIAIGAQTNNVIDENVYIQWNSTDQSLDFVFA